MNVYSSSVAKVRGLHRERTGVGVYVIAFVFREQDVACRDSVKGFIHSEKEAHCSLSLERLQASDRPGAVVTGSMMDHHRPTDYCLRGSRSETSANSLGPLKPLATESRYATSTSKIPCSLRRLRMLLEERNATTRSHSAPPTKLPPKS